MDNPVTTYLKHSGNYSKDELALIEEALSFKILEKGEYLLQEGQVCSEFCFIEKGAIYQYKKDSELEEIVIDLSVDCDWVIDHKSFTARKPSIHNIQAFEKTSIYQLSIEAIHYLISQSQSFLQMGKILDESTSRVGYFDNNNSPDEKYQHLLETKPLILQKFPLKIIASYLKITPETLSRVRRRFLQA